MAKEKIIYVYPNCGQDSPKWMGKCPDCGQQSTFKGVRIDSDTSQSTARSVVNAFKDNTEKNKPLRLKDISALDEPHIDIHDDELNRVLGGGLVSGSIILLGGEPGIGKSTLTLQAILQMTDKRVLCVSGEKNAHQLKMHTERLSKAESDHMVILCETSLELIFGQIRTVKPELVVIGSIQTIAMEHMENSPGSISQVGECAVLLPHSARNSGIPVILIRHINKEGTLVGPKILEHIVDTVIQFEGGQHYIYRILHAIKNRFGSTSELGIYEMQQDGLRQVNNPSGLSLTQDHDGLNSIAVSSAVEGVRPFLLETQAPVSSAAYGTPQRSTTGSDQRRLNMLLAVLEKRVGFKLMQKNVFLNVAGELRVINLAMDLSVIAAILSSNVNTPIESGWCMVGKVGLSGEVRPANRIGQRIAETEKLSFVHLIFPRYNLQETNPRRYQITLRPVHKVGEALRTLFE